MSSVETESMLSALSVSEVVISEVNGVLAISPISVTLQDTPPRSPSPLSLDSLSLKEVSKSRKRSREESPSFEISREQTPPQSPVAEEPPGAPQRLKWVALRARRPVKSDESSHPIFRLMREATPPPSVPPSSPPPAPKKCRQV